MVPNNSLWGASQLNVSGAGQVILWEAGQQSLWIAYQLSLREIARCMNHCGTGQQNVSDATSAQSLWSWASILRVSLKVAPGQDLAGTRMYRTR